MAQAVISCDVDSDSVVVVKVRINLLIGLPVSPFSRNTTIGVSQVLYESQSTCRSVCCAEFGTQC